MLIIAAIGLASAVWDGSAVAGVAADFPGDGLFGACNSFPRDTAVTVTNLENGKVVTITVTDGVENPGVFIALSPKAAAELGMRSGATARIRAVAITASQAEMGVPSSARAGETTDPDFNPKVYVERDKAAAKAASAAAAVPTAPAIAAAPAEAAAPTMTESPQAATQSSGAPMPAVTPAAIEPSSRIAPADELPEPASSLSIPNSPKNVPLGMSLPSPDLPSVSQESAPIPSTENQALEPEILGGSKPQPRRPVLPRVAMSDPTLPVVDAGTPAIKPENASVDALSRPAASASAAAIALAEPTLAPEELPEAVLNRIIAPSKIYPMPVLADAGIPATASEKTQIEMIALERPSYADQVGAEPSGSTGTQEPDVPRPSESLAADKPNSVEPAQTIAELAEPGASDAATAETAEKPAIATAPSAALATPEVPNPSENIAVERPVPPLTGEQKVVLEPAAPRPPQSAAARIPDAGPTVSPPAAVATVKGQGSAEPVQSPASIPLLKGLAKGSFYVQIGVYGTNEALQSAVGGFKATYPLAVESLRTKAGNAAFRLFVGPLTRDESGVVLVKIRSLGYKDAYVRKGS
jgi:hypothetical protein